MAGQISVIQPQSGQPPQTVYVWFTAEITPLTSESLLAVMANLVQQRIAHVQLLLATPGGNVMNGITLYNALRAFPFELTTHNIGNVDSIGNAVFLAGEHRYACSNATFMFHGVGFQAPQQMHFQERQLRERLASVLADQKRIGEIIKDRTSLTEDDIARLFLEEQTKDVVYARANGVIHDVRQVQIPFGSAIQQLVFQR